MNSRRLIIFVIFCTVLVLILLARPTLHFIQSTTQWDAAKAKWDQNKADNYIFSSTIETPECGLTVTGSITVVSGRGSYSGCLGGEVTVEYYFELAHRCAFDFLRSCEVDYDSAYGYPKRIPFSSTGDSIQIIDFSPLASTPNSPVATVSPN